MRLELTLILTVLSIGISAFRYFPKAKGFSSKLQNSQQSLLFEGLEEDEADAFRKVARNYLKDKYDQQLQNNGNDIERCVSSVLRSILPPVTGIELEAEIKSILNPIKEEKKMIISNDHEQIIDALLNNKFWSQAGAVVVQELIYLDSLYHFYQKKQSILNNEDYEELKNQLTWAGSDVPSLNAKEALFLTAVASFRRGDKLLEESEYNSLKQQLRDQNSWIVQRKADALEKLGLNTFLGYLHRSL